MPILGSSKAAAVGAGVNNLSLSASASVMPRALVVIGTNAAAKDGTTTENVPRLSGGPAEAGTLYGFGSMLHRLVLAAWAGHGGSIPTWVIPQHEAGGAVAATSTTFAITGPATASGVLAAYVAGKRYSVSVASGDSAATVGTALAALINADTECPTSASGTATVTLLAKSKGPWGNSISVAVNALPGDALPAGISVVVTVLASGAGVPTIASALNGLGTGSNRNTLPDGRHMTDLVHGYLGTATAQAATVQDQTSLTAISAYGGLANEDPPLGCYDHLVAKPFRAVHGDVTTGAAVPAAATSLATTNTWDRTSGMVCAPGSLTHPSEIAAQAMAVIALKAADVPASGYVGLPLTGVDLGYVANQAGTRWTNEYTQRDTAVKAGVSPTLVQGGVVLLQNVVTFYMGNTSVPANSNGYGEMVHLAKLQNMLYAEAINFRGPKWVGYFIVTDTALVTDPAAKAKARDIDAVKDDCVALIKSFAGYGWIYEIDNAIKSVAVTIRPDGTGFLPTFAVQLSGVGNVIDLTMAFDTAIQAAA